MLRSNGYYKFNKEDIRFDADTARGSAEVDVRMTLKLHQKDGRSQARNHTRYKVGNVYFYTDVPSLEGKLDTVAHDGYFFISSGEKHFRDKMLMSHLMIKPRTIYNDNMMRRSYTNFTRLPAILYSAINLDERTGTDTLDCRVTLTHDKPHVIG